jgi:deoxyribodipyrimidine photo-lyase
VCSSDLVRGVHWRAGADWLVAHLLDGDLASNHLSWQWVAGTGSHKPYLFNADNVARFAPPHWHSPGTAIDRTYEELDRVARGLEAIRGDHHTALSGMAEPALLHVPPTALGLQKPDTKALERLRGRPVWLVHPWALRAPPADLPMDTIVIGIFPHEHHSAWPWPAERWQWVHAAMSALAAECWFIDSSELACALAGAAEVRTVGDPHLGSWLPSTVQVEPEPRLFPAVERPCSSFSQWWTRATRGMKQASELL